MTCACCEPAARNHPKGSSAESIDNAYHSLKQLAREIAATAVRLQRDAIRLEALKNPQRSSYPLVLCGDDRLTIVTELNRIVMALSEPKELP
jgi:hypothetical protein